MDPLLARMKGFFHAAYAGEFQHFTPIYCQVKGEVMILEIFNSKTKQK
jgi:hypothetical protein